MTTSIVTAHGWELHNSSGGSDKFYRVLIVERVVVFNWGARRTRGQFTVRVYATRDQALAAAAAQTDAKAAKHYAVTRDMTQFTLDAAIANALTSLPVGKVATPDRDTCGRIVDTFKFVATTQGTSTPEASR